MGEGGVIAREGKLLDWVKSPIGTDMQDYKEVQCAVPDAQGVSKTKMFKEEFVDKLEFL